jgi:hypothetical protein
MADDTWFPLSKGHPQARALNPENEAAVADFLRDNYIRTETGATRTQLRHLCLDSYAAQSDEERHFERFCTSTTFLHEFQTRQGLSLRTPHKERRAELDESYAAYFLERLNRLSNDYRPDKVFNMDETCWRLFEASQKVLAEKGAETVKLRAPKSKKTSFSALGAISTSGQRLPLWVLAKGKTPRSERKFGAHPGFILQHTDSGWATENLISNCIEWLHCDIDQGYPAALILDIYPTYRTDLVFQTATANDVELLFVPAGSTGRFEPMDRRIFGDLKARARGGFGRRRWLSGRTDIGYDENVTVLARWWDAIPGKNVRKAWNMPQRSGKRRSQQ